MIIGVFFGPLIGYGDSGVFVVECCSFPYLCSFLGYASRNHLRLLVLDIAIITNLSLEPTLPETNSSHPKMAGWNTSFLLGSPIFKGELLVSGRGILSNFPYHFPCPFVHWSTGPWRPARMVISNFSRFRESANLQSSMTFGQTPCF